MTLRPIPRRIPLAAAVGSALAAITLVACGGGGGGGSPAPAPVVSTPAPAPAPAPTPAPEPVSNAACARAYAAPVARPASGQTFCASLATAPDAAGMGVENGKACQARTAVDIVKEMGQGWNLGNTLDASGGAGTDPLQDETSWGNPKTTKALVDAVRQAGFTTLRVPVSWDRHFSGSGDTIDTQWLDRVEEVANYALANNMTVIVNIHHNNGWEAPTEANEANAKVRLARLWTQIATRFRDYDHHVVFEAMNEPRVAVNGVDDWTGKTEYYKVVNRLNAAALGAIRATGGNNARRLVMLPPYVAAPADQQLNDFLLPPDPMLAVSTHAYYPYDFALNLKGTDKFTGQADIDALFNRLNTKFVAKGIPVVMGEWGSTDKNNLAERVKHASYFVKGAYKANIPTVWWDNGTKAQNESGTAEVFALFDRANNSLLKPEITDAIFCAAQ